MKKAIIYKKEECVVIKSIIINNGTYTFFVGLNNKNILYLRQINNGINTTYAALNKLVNAFPEYKTPSTFNIKILLDTFVNSINYKIRAHEISNSDELLDIISQFEKLISDPYIMKMTDTNVNTIFSKQAMFEVTNEIKKLGVNSKRSKLSELLNKENTSNDVFLSQNWLEDNVDNKQLLYESLNNSKKAHRKGFLDFLFNNKILNVYMVLFVMAAVMMTVLVYSLYNWKKTGSDTNKEIDKIREEVLIEEEPSNSSSNRVVSNVTSNNTSNTNKANNSLTTKYGKLYADYINVPISSVNFNKLKQMNGDTVGWIYVNNTNVNYPIVQFRDNSYYLNHSIDKTKNVAGWIFADYRANLTNFKRNTVIYGHGRTDNVMFGSLSKATNESWYKNSDNWIITIITPTAKTYWHIVSVYIIPQEAYYLTHNFENDASYEKWVNKMLSRSKYNFVKNSKTFDYGKNPPNKNDKFLTLSTCKDYNGNRIVVQAVLVGN